MQQPTEDIYSGPTLHITPGGEGIRVHRLIDDICYPTRASKTVVRRDPMVEALFGAASIQVAHPAPAPGKKSKNRR